jgi:single-strand DNA-binding protein
MTAYVGTVGSDPEMRFTPQGIAVAKFSLAVTPRHKNEATGRWEDGQTTWYRVSAWRQMAENVAETVTRGMRVVVVAGDPVEREWTNRNGETKTDLELNADEVAPSLKWATAVVRKAERTAPAAPADDPWAKPVTDDVPF